ncbi:fimbrial protein [Klebsiella pneumoniae]|jgi:major type 1 subunit fimbrin (pilin)|uniref:fimbrial protein n=1 Tax=Klebsiella pneumoniae TaxID=573 RepID=UPI00034690D8|nr:fimbrial protein [Klebsiella pneumoniae]MCE7402758.1 fimbrial protein [Klebsiella pneumoniae]WJT30389.1 fimbrial protein [Klebsiella pneumoniae]HDT7201648.1 fimbrial protein [Klebsiella pneumoniae]HDT7217945.1 fimbrial protein [Klebsiella pneumoniae]HEE1279272.1 fimbrial protein [Klebsiella pneumoniae]
MSIKKSVIAAAVFASLSGVSMMANAAPSADVTLEGIITNTTCDVSVNNGLATLNVGVYKASSFTPNTQQGSVALPVELTNCADETGALIIQGQSASSDPSKQLFTAATGDTVGFMIKDVQVAESQNVALDVTSADTNSYSFNVGMGTTDATPAAGSYSVPVTVAYIVN